jgi:FkbM family methyltransferase
MTFISYAQNFEDITLWRALQFFPEGFYIDVGAYDPKIHSVTKAFYDRNWRGINIDAQSGAYHKLCVERPRDINIHAAVSDADDKKVILYINQLEANLSGWATVDKAMAEQYRDRGMPLTDRSVETKTLRSICEQYVNGEIHFLKIDVEGHEGAVIRGMDFQRWRPWIMIIEIPLHVEIRDGQLKSVEMHPDWEQLILEAHYHPVHYDGLNRYYIAEEHMNLAGAFDVPPSVRDDFQLCYGHHLSYSTADLEERIWMLSHPFAALWRFIRNRIQLTGRIS